MSGEAGTLTGLDNGSSTNGFDPHSSTRQSVVRRKEKTEAQRLKIQAAKALKAAEAQKQQQIDDLNVQLGTWQGELRSMEQDVQDAKDAGVELDQEFLDNMSVVTNHIATANAQLDILHGKTADPTPAPSEENAPVAQAETNAGDAAADSGTNGIVDTTASAPSDNAPAEAEEDEEVEDPEAEAAAEIANQIAALNAKIAKVQNTIKGLEELPLSDEDKAPFIKTENDKIAEFEKEILALSSPKSTEAVAEAAPEAAAAAPETVAAPEAAAAAPETVAAPEVAAPVEAPVEGDAAVAAAPEAVAAAPEAVAAAPEAAPEAAAPEAVAAAPEAAPETAAAAPVEGDAALAAAPEAAAAAPVEGDAALAAAPEAAAAPEVLAVEAAAPEVVAAAPEVVAAAPEVLAVEAAAPEVVAAAPEAAVAAPVEGIDQLRAQFAALSSQLHEAEESVGSLKAKFAEVQFALGLTDTSHDTALPVLAGQDGLTVCDTPA